MKKILLLILLYISTAFSQTTDTTRIYGDTLKAGNIQIFKNWDYRPGDDSAWAFTKFSSVGWDTMDCRMNMDSLKAYKWNGIGWFRKAIVIDSSLMNETIGMTLNHYGASELYINGKLVNKYGSVAANNGEDEEIYYSNSEPIVFTFDTSSTYLIAVRYSNHLPVDNPYLYHRFRNNAGFFLTIKSLSEAKKYYGVTQANSTTQNALLSGIFISIFVIYILLFLFYSTQKEYLYYAFFTFSLSFIFVNSALTNILHSGITYFYIISIIDRLFALTIFISVLAFLYQIFYGKLLKIFNFILLVGLSAYTLQFFRIFETITGYIFAGIVGFTSIEILRVIFLAVKRKKNNAWVIGAGVCVFAFAIIVIFILNLISQTVSISGLYGFAILLSIPLSMSIYLARSSSQTNENLEIQLANVKQLSEEAIKQEKKSAKLELETQLVKIENERKTKELEEARQLQLSMLPESLPQLPNLDIAVYMQTATEVGGDYYDFRTGPGETLNAALGDATGHGMQAGTLVTIMKGIFTLEAENNEVLPFFEKSVQALKEIKLGRLMMAFVFLKIRGNRLLLSNAGAPPVYIFRKNNNEVEEVDNQGMPLGAMINFPYKETITELSKGDVIFALSDGLPELTNKDGIPFGYERVKNIFKEAGDRSADEIIEHLKNNSKEWSGDKAPDDDVTFVVIKMR